MTDKEIINEIEVAIKNCPPLEPDTTLQYSAYAIQMADGFWRGFLIAMLAKRNRYDLTTTSGQATGNGRVKGIGASGSPVGPRQPQECQ